MSDADEGENGESDENTESSEASEDPENIGGDATAENREGAGSAGSDERDGSVGSDENAESAARRGQTRTVVAVALLFSLLGATLPRLASGDPLAAWEVLLLSTLGLAAGVATLGGDSVRTAAAVFRESGP
ncbi:hypothetical protein [Haloprofundus salilacus]|uniref:hypothetical protein n=1 Tax=Haloprofundus salilacus TaxID=2876190 RepID=UPI001CCEF531|nr:hypothetical protein [Haloprofundus salilacus]